MILRAPRGGVDIFGKHYRAGEFTPFYVPRPEMPQIDEADLPLLVTEAQLAGHGPRFQILSPSELRAHQRIDHNKAVSMKPEVKLKPVLVSADNYVLDGNHRWYNHMHAGDQYMNTIRLGLPFEQALAWLFTREYTYKLTPSTPERN